MNNEILVPDIKVPVSKSIGARFLVATYFAGTLPADPYFEDNDDLMVLQQALLSLYSDEKPIDYGDTPIDVHASGTAFRFVTAVCASTPGAEFVVTGTPRLCARPMKQLIDVLREAGADITPLGKDETGPYRITGKKLKGGECSIAGNISSQFISALMLVAPTWEEGMKLKFTTSLVSRPYIEMTASVMGKFGIDVKLNDECVVVKPGKYKEPDHYKVEADWSSASFFYEACVLSGNEIIIGNLIPPKDSMQGDAGCESIFRKLGVSSKFHKDGVVLNAGLTVEDYVEIDFRDMPDLVLPYAVAAMLSGTKFKFSGVENLRIKESDRVASLINESAKLGYVLKYEDGCIIWEGTKRDCENDPIIATYDDHRVAMAFAMCVFKTGSIKIAHPDVVEKSFADFWNQIVKLNVEMARENDIMLITMKS